MPPLTQEQTNTINEASKNATIGAENLINSPGRPSLPTSQANLFDLTQYLTPKQSQIDTKVQDLQTKSNTVFDELFGAMGATENRGAQTTAIEAQYGVPQLTLDLNQIDNEITQKALEFRREQEAIQKSTGSVAQKNAQLADVSRKQYSQMADMEVVRAAKAKTFDAINSIISKKIDRQFADEDARINNLKFQYETIKSDLTKSEDRQYNEMITREERAFNIAKSRYEQVETAKGELIKNATLNGAGTATLKKIMAAQTLEDAYASAGSYGLSIDDKIKRANYAKALSELSGGSSGQLTSGEVTGIPSQDMAKILDKTGAKNNTNIQNAIGVIKGLETIAQRNPEGTFIGMAPIRILPTIFRGKEAKTERQFNVGDINAINLKVQQWASGASLTKEQTKQVERMVPDKNDTDEQAKRKINQLTQYMMGQIGGELAAQGIQSTTPAFDFFTETPTDIQFDENGNVVIQGETADEDFWSK